MNKISSALLGLLVAGCGLAANTTLAATVTNSMPVTSSVVANCKINTFDLSISNYDPTNSSASYTASTSFTVNCTKGATAVVSLDQGKNPTAGSTCDAPARQLKAADGSLLNYQFWYFGSSSSYQWGCGTANTGGGTSASVNTSMPLNLQFAVPSRQNVPAGSYADQLTLTVSF